MIYRLCFKILVENKVHFLIMGFKPKDSALIDDLYTIAVKVSRLYLLLLQKYSKHTLRKHLWETWLS